MKFVGHKKVKKTTTTTTTTKEKQRQKKKMYIERALQKNFRRVYCFIGFKPA